MNLYVWLKRIGKWPALITLGTLTILFIARMLLDDKQAASLIFALAVIPFAVFGIRFLFRRVAVIPFAAVATATTAATCAAIFLTLFKSDGFWIMASISFVPLLYSVLLIREMVICRQKAGVERWHIYTTFSGQFIVIFLSMLGVIQNWW